MGHFLFSMVFYGERQSMRRAEELTIRHWRKDVYKRQDLAYEDFETSSILVEEYEKYMGRQMDRIYYDIIRIQFDAEQFVEEEKVLPDMPLDWVEIGLSEVLLGQGPTGDVPLKDNN